MTDDNPLVSIIIVNYNGKAFLEPCLTSVERQEYANYEVLVVDNASTDGSAEFLAARFPRIRVIRSETNLGFAGGNNLGFAHALGDYLVLLNNDTVVEKGWLRHLVAAAVGRERIGAVGSKILFYTKFLPVSFLTESVTPSRRGASDDGRPLGFRLREGIAIEGCDYQKRVFEAGFGGLEWDPVNSCQFRWAAGAARVFVPYTESDRPQILSFAAAGFPGGTGQTVHILIGAVLRESIRLTDNFEEFELEISPDQVARDGVDIINNAGSFRRRGGAAGDIGFAEVDHGQFDRPLELNCLCGCSVLIKKRMLDDIGGFDGRLFMYYEDVDLFWRATKRGWGLSYCPSSVVRHRHAGSSQEWSPPFIFHVYRNQFLIVVKNGSFKEVLGAGAALFRPLVSAVARVLGSLRRGSLDRAALRRLRQHGRVVASAGKYTLPFLYTRWRGRG